MERKNGCGSSSVGDVQGVSDVSPGLAICLLRENPNPKDSKKAACVKTGPLLQ